MVFQDDLKTVLTSSKTATSTLTIDRQLQVGIVAARKNLETSLKKNGKPYKITGEKVVAYDGADDKLKLPVDYKNGNYILIGATVNGKERQFICSKDGKPLAIMYTKGDKQITEMIGGDKDTKKRVLETQNTGSYYSDYSLDIGKQGTKSYGNGNSPIYDINNLKNIGTTSREDPLRPPISANEAHDIYSNNKIGQTNKFVFIVNFEKKGALQGTIVYMTNIDDPKKTNKGNAKVILKNGKFDLDRGEEDPLLETHKQKLYLSEFKALSKIPVERRSENLEKLLQEYKNGEIKNTNRV